MSSLAPATVQWLEFRISLSQYSICITVQFSNIFTLSSSVSFLELNQLLICSSSHTAITMWLLHVLESFLCVLTYEVIHHAWCALTTLCCTHLWCTYSDAGSVHWKGFLVPTIELPLSEEAHQHSGWPIALACLHWTGLYNPWQLHLGSNKEMLYQIISSLNLQHTPAEREYMEMAVDVGVMSSLWLWLSAEWSSSLSPASW